MTGPYAERSSLFRPLEWREMPTIKGKYPEEWVAWHPWGSWTVKDEGNEELPFVVRPFPAGPSNYETAEAGKKAAEDEHRRRCLGLLREADRG